MGSVPESGFYSPLFFFSHFYDIKWVVVFVGLFCFSYELDIFGNPVVFSVLR